MSIAPRDEFVSIGNLRMHARRWSPTTPTTPTLPPILLLHGLASAARIWDLVAPLLAERGYTVTAFDQRGHGESDKPDTGYDFATIVADDAAAVAALNIVNSVVVGHSWGASVALQYAATFPAQVHALVLVDGATGQLSARNWTREEAMKALTPPRFAGTPRETFLSFFQRGPLGQQWTPELEDIALHIVQLRDDDTVAPRLAFENHMQIVAAMWDQPTFALYQQVTCPITLISAEQSSASTAQSDLARARREGIVHIQELNPRVQVVTMADTIHDIPLQRPERLAEEIIRTAALQV